MTVHVGSAVVMSLIWQFSTVLGLLVYSVNIVQEVQVLSLNYNSAMSVLS